MFSLTTYGDRQSGKTESMLRAILWELLIENREIVVVCHDYKTARNTGERLVKLIDHWAPNSCCKIRRTNGNFSVDYHGGGRVRFFTHRGQGHRGFVADSIFLDDVPDMTQANREDVSYCFAGSREPRLHEYVSTGELGSNASES